MDILNLVADMANKFNSISDAAMKDTIRKKPAIRKRFYLLVKDYQSAAGTRPLNDFFEWYLKQLDKRMEIAPQLPSLWYKYTNRKNDSSLRSFLEACHRSDIPDFKEKIKEWIPNDEYMILASQKKSDITDGLDIVIGLCAEKEEAGKQIVAILSASLPTILIGLAFHSLLYGFIYPVFVNISENATWDGMTTAQKVLYTYETIAGNWPWIVGILFFLITFIAQSVKKWSKRGMFIRENYIDFIPPYSLSKLSSQYNIASLTYNYLRCGMPEFDAIMEVKRGSTNYVAYQIDKITSQVNVKMTDAFNTLYMGAPGCDIAERGQYVNLQESLKDLIGKMKEHRDEAYSKTINRTFKFTLKPIIFGSIGLAVLPLIFQIGAMIPDN